MKNRIKKVICLILAYFLGIISVKYYPCQGHGEFYFIPFSVADTETKYDSPVI